MKLPVATKRSPLLLALVGAVVVALVAAVLVVGLRLLADRGRTDLERALAMAPVDAQRLSWTDWAGVRRELGADLSLDSRAVDVTDFLDAGYEADLTSTSALVQSAETLQASFGFSPATIDWELFSQSERAASVLIGVADDTDLEAVGERLLALGYTAPDEPDGTWVGDEDQLARLGPVTPELTFLTLDGDAGLIHASDTQAGLEAAVAEARDDDSPGEALEEAAAGAGEALSAALYDGDQVCSALSMASADRGAQTEATRLVAEAGGVSPIRGFAIAAEPGGGVRVVMSFETDDQARADADVRATLASGPAPGQGGDFADRFSLGEVSADGTRVTLELQPVEGSYVVSDLSTGPVLFASC